jgi:hypothetical protein
MAKLRGAHVIGTTSTVEKARAGGELGADGMILYTEVTSETEVERITAASAGGPPEAEEGERWDD